MYNAQLPPNTDFHSHTYSHRYTRVYSERMHTNTGLTRVYAPPVQTHLCASSDMQCQRYTRVLPWIRAHTHDLLKAAPPAHGSAEQTNRTSAVPAAVPAAATTRPVLRSPSARGNLRVGTQAQLGTHVSPGLSPDKHPGSARRALFSGTMYMPHRHSSLLPILFFCTQQFVSVCFALQIMHIHLCLQPGHWASLSQSLQASWHSQSCLVCLVLQ